MELYARGAFALSQMMEGGDDRVLAHTGLKRITLHIRVCIFFSLPVLID